MQGQKILYIIAQKGFQDYEFLVPSRIFRDNGFIVDVASIEKGTAIGSLGSRVAVDIAVKDADIDYYDALVIAGGPGALALKERNEVIEIILDAFNKGKLVAAICISPVILAEAGILKGKKATVWNQDSRQSSILKKRGATYTGKAVEADGNIITANGPGAAEEFAKKVADTLLRR